MRRLTPLCLCALLMGVGCVGPHTSGAAWAIQNQDDEIAYFRLSDATRQSSTRAYELGLADEALGNERQRLDAALGACPGPRESAPYSSGDTVRDAIRLRARGDTQRLAQVAQLALVDWYVRRAATSGDEQFCQSAEAALTSAASPQTPASDPLQALPLATVTRDTRLAIPSPTSDSAMVTLSQYVLGFADSITAAAPLPQYLALVYGGSLVGSSGAGMDDETAATAVDTLAPAHPDWEPDALYAALREARG
jgi:hypothetical protein